MAVEWGRARRSRRHARRCAAPGRSAAKRWGRAARVGREVGGEVSGTARRGPGGAGIGTLGREPEMGEDLANDPGILNGRDQAHAPPTARTREHVKLEGAPHKGRPRPIARRAGSFRPELRDAACPRVNRARRLAWISIEA